MVHCNNRLLIRSFTLSVAFTAALGCGGGGSSESGRARSAHDVEGSDAPRSAERSRFMEASGEVGALDEEKVTETFNDALSELQACLRRGAKRNEFVGGEIGFFLRIDGDGRVADAFAERSTIGDRQTEKCMLDKLKGREWPKPQGGEVGLARNSFDFDMPNDVRPPTPWESDQIAEALDKLSSEISECKNGSSGTFTATLYVDTEGKALGVGIAPPDEGGEASCDCLADVLEKGEYPSPGSWPAKVTFSL